MEFKLFFVFLIAQVNGHLDFEIANTAFDQKLYQDVLDSEECVRQIDYIKGNSLLWLQFADAGIRTPRGIFLGNFLDAGNYHQCLGINFNLEDMDIHGKYCAIRIPLDQIFPSQLSDDILPWSQLNSIYRNVKNETGMMLENYDFIRSEIQSLTGVWDEEESRTSVPSGPFSGSDLRLSVCIPKPCTTQQAMTSLLFNLTEIGFQYRDDFCRLPNDKPWVAADYVAIVVFSIIGLLTVLSTSYDLFYTFVRKLDRKKLNVLYQSFSVYTNGKRLMTFNSGPGALQCLDGIRSLAMMWVIHGHAFITLRLHMNSLYVFEWMTSLRALWVTSGTITVDTFFTMAGLLLVYTTAGKMNGGALLKNLHLFYLNRILRMTPLIAAAVLLQASYLNRASDGPFWITNARQTNLCRTYWWTTLFHVQNLLNPRNICISHSWYIAIDVHLYIVSPLVLYWVLSGKKRHAWIALIVGLLVPLVASTIYNFHMDFPAGNFVPSRTDPHGYLPNYYFNTMTRAAPFFVGMILGYVLHLYRHKKVRIPWVIATVLWVCAISITTTIFFFVYFIKQLDWDNQLVDNIMNSFMRPIWALALGWIIFACVHGYGGPANWFLCLDIWKVPARLSYGMYIFHYPIMFIIGESAISTFYFNPAALPFNFLAQFSLALVVSFVVTLLIDSPFSAVFKQLLDKKKKKPEADTKTVNGDKPDTQQLST